MFKLVEEQTDFALLGIRWFFSDRIETILNLVNICYPLLHYHFRNTLTQESVRCGVHIWRKRKNSTKHATCWKQYTMWAHLWMNEIGPIKTKRKKYAHTHWERSRCHSSLIAESRHNKKQFLKIIHFPNRSMPLGCVSNQLQWHVHRNEQMCCVALLSNWCIAI